MITCSVEKALSNISYLKLLSDGHKRVEGRKAIANPHGQEPITPDMEEDCRGRTSGS